MSIPSCCITVCCKTAYNRSCYCCNRTHNNYHHNNSTFLRYIFSIYQNSRHSFFQPMTFSAFGVYSHIKITGMRVILDVIANSPRPAGPPQTVPPRRGWMMLNVESGIFPSSASLRRGLRGCVKLPPPRRLAAPAWQARRAAAIVA